MQAYVAVTGSPASNELSPGRSENSPVAKKPKLIKMPFYRSNGDRMHKIQQKSKLAALGPLRLRVPQFLPRELMIYGNNIPL